MFRLLGIVTGALSLVALAWKGFSIGLGPTTILIVEYYEALASVIFGWAEPYIRTELSFIRDIFGIDLHLFPHWKHVFALMILYFGACAKITWIEYSRLVAVLVAVWGGLIAFLASVSYGSFPLDNPETSILAASIPMLGVVVFELGLTAWDAKYFRNEGIRFALIGASIVAVASFATTLPVFRSLPNMGLAALALFVLSLSMYWVWYGANKPDGVGETVWEKFLAAATSRLGFLLLSSMVGAIGFLLFNAGLKEFGL